MIRPRQDDDLERLVPVLREVYTRDGYPANWPNHPARWLTDERTIGAWVADELGDLVGHVALIATDRDDAWPEWRDALGVSGDGLAVIRRLFVAPTWRRTGLATRLIDQAASRAADKELPLVLDVADHNHAAINFWEQHGWRRVGHAALPPGDEGRPLRLILFAAPGAGRAADASLDP